MKSYYSSESAPMNTKGHGRYSHLGGIQNGEAGNSYSDAHLATDMIYTAHSLLGTMNNDQAKQAQAILANSGTANDKSIRNTIDHLKAHMGHDLKAMRAADLLEGSLQAFHSGTQSSHSNGAIHVGSEGNGVSGSYYNKSNSFQYTGESDPLTGQVLGLGIAEVNDGRSN